MSTLTWPKWRVERIGSRTSGYAPGWIVMDGPRDKGAVFATFTEAIQFAHAHAAAEFERDSKRALMKLAPRGVPAAGLPEAPKRRPITDGEIRAARAMRDNRRTWAEIADTLGVNESTIYKAVRRAAAS